MKATLRERSKLQHLKSQQRRNQAKIKSVSIEMQNMEQRVRRSSDSIAADLTRNEEEDPASTHSDIDKDSDTFIFSPQSQATEEREM